MTADAPILSTDRAERVYGRVRAVDDVDVEIHAGRSIGIAGESGSGKTTLLRLLLGLEVPSGGTVRFEGTDLATADADTKRRYRRSVQAVFQDPGGSFNPRMRVWRSVAEPTWSAERIGRRDQKDVALAALAGVGLGAADADKYPHQLSGGQRQRAAIARALCAHPKVVLLDEPVTSLDLSIRGSILNLLVERAQATGTTYVVVSHDLAAIYHLAEELYIMYRGRVVEHGPTVDVIAEPKHPYTRMLVASVGDPLYAPEVDDDSIPPPEACPYVNRCPHAFEPCSAMPPELETGPDRWARCHLYGPAAGGPA